MLPTYLIIDLVIDITENLTTQPICFIIITINDINSGRQ